MTKQEETTVPTTAETVAAPDQPQTQIRIDDAGAPTYYSTTAQIGATAEEIILNFSQGIRPTGQANVATLKIDSRVILSPYAAKRLALALGQTVQRYEQEYGTVEIDPRKRSRTRPAAAPSATTRAS
jgi:hypothetical protein